MKRIYVVGFAAFFALAGVVACGDDDSGTNDNNANVNVNQNSNVNDNTNNNTSGVCGDGQVDTGEDCDDSGESATCDSDCTSVSCGDGAINTTAGEVCDDGTSNSDSAVDACRTTCEEASCGDGVTDTGEDCDDSGESATCNSDCTTSACGDGTVNTTDGEECDDGTSNSDSVADACRTSCLAAGCGDNVRDTGEECDDGNTQSGDGCSATCVSEGGLTTVLLIPDSTNDRVVMFSTQDGSQIGEFIPSFGQFSLPINATQAPNGDIYVSDQNADAVFRFDNQGQFVATVADATEGMDNLRGIDFYNNQLYISSNSGIHLFTLDGSSLGDYVTGYSAFDVLFYSDGRMLSSNTSADQIWLYPTGSTTGSSVHAVNFSEQISFTPGGNLLVASFSEDSVTELDSTWSVVRSVTLNSARGIHQLDNGNWLATGSSSGVVEIDPATGTVVNTRATNSEGSWRFIERVQVHPSVLP